MRAVPLTTAEERSWRCWQAPGAGDSDGLAAEQSRRGGNLRDMFSLTQIFRFPFRNHGDDARRQGAEFNHGRCRGDEHGRVFELSGIQGASRFIAG